MKQLSRSSGIRVGLPLLSQTCDGKRGTSELLLLELFDVGLLIAWTVQCWAVELLLALVAHSLCFLLSFGNKYVCMFDSCFPSFSCYTHRSVVGRSQHICGLI